MRLLPATSVGILAALLTGCHTEMPSAPAPPAISVSSVEQSQVGQTAQSYVTALQARDYTKAKAMMSPAFQDRTPPAQLKALLQGPDRPLVGAKDFQFDPVQPTSHGTRAILRARFLGSDGRQYRTNFLLTKSGQTWLVDGLVPPATHQKAAARQQDSSAVK